MAATMVHSTTGSWHNSGYYGHFRSRIRNDFLNEFRQRVRPQPPPTYIDRSRQPATKHVFSRHDNRERFLNNALYFEEGLGRRRVHDAKSSYKPDFIAWMPHKQELDRRQPLCSTYRENFHHKHSFNPFHQHYSANIAREADKTRFVTGKRSDITAVFTDGTQSSSPSESVYKAAYNGDDHHKKTIQELNLISKQSAACRRVISRSQSATPMERDSVASCMTWQVPTPPMRPKTAALLKPDNSYISKNRICVPTETSPHQSQETVPTNDSTSSRAEIISVVM